MKVFISAGDFSGDIHGALLLQKLKQLSPHVQCFAIGGEKLREAGAEIIEDSSTWSAMGIFDALPKLPRILRAFPGVKKKIAELKPDGIVFIDCPAFNVRLARGVAPLQIPSAYFFPPSQWNDNVKRAAEVGKLVRKIIAPFKRTADLYKRAGVPVLFSGHPLVDQIPNVSRVMARPKAEAISLEPVIANQLNLDPDRPVIGILPGSREQEIRYILPLELNVAERLALAHPELQFVIPIAKKNLESMVHRALQKCRVPIVTIEGNSHDIMRISKILLTASGTATLEAALFETPMVIVYKVSALTWCFERPFVKVSFAGIPNLLAEKGIVPEFIQEKASVANVTQAMLELLESEEKRSAMIFELRNIRPQLGEPGVMDRVAREILVIARPKAEAISLDQDKT